MLKIIKIVCLILLCIPLLSLKGRSEEKIVLKINFNDYKTNAICFQILDDNKIIEEWHDSVKMNILNNENYFKDRTFLIIITENPIRNQFLEYKKEFYIIIDKNKLLSKDSSGDLPNIYSSDIIFK